MITWASLEFISSLVKTFFQLIRFKQIHATRVKRTLSAGKGVGATFVFWSSTYLIKRFSSCSKCKWNNAHGFTCWNIPVRQLVWYLYILMNMCGCSLWRCQEPPMGKLSLHQLTIFSYVFFSFTKENLVLNTIVFCDDWCLHIDTSNSDEVVPHSLSYMLFLSLPQAWNNDHWKTVT